MSDNDWFFYRWDARYDEPVQNTTPRKKSFFLPLIIMALTIIALLLI